MAATMTASQRRTGDAISDFAGRAAWVYLAAGILSVLFGAVVLSLVLDWVGLYTVALCDIREQTEETYAVARIIVHPPA